jgi:hypothetical protein
VLIFKNAILATLLTTALDVIGWLVSREEYVVDPVDMCRVEHRNPKILDDLYFAVRTEHCRSMMIGD